MKCRGYLDIETTGLSASSADLTVIGLLLDKGDETEFIQLVGADISKAKLEKLIKRIDIIYTYNGARFDLPFIEVKLNMDFKKYCQHTDLMYHCWENNLYGGLKCVERTLGIKRNLTDVDGYVAIQLWYKYIKHGDKNSLQTLLDYNKEDVFNLKVLRKKLGV